MALDAAWAWRLENPGTLWPMPPKGPIPPTARRYKIVDVKELFCSERRAPEVATRRTRTVGFDVLAHRLMEAGSALRLDRASLEENLELAAELHVAEPYEYEPWKSWSIVTQALLDAQERDLFLRL